MIKLVNIINVMNKIRPTLHYNFLTLLLQYSMCKCYFTLFHCTSSIHSELGIWLTNICRSNLLLCIR